MAKAPYKYVLFDLDGTLCDPGPGIVDSIQYALNKFGIDEQNEAALRRFVGPPLIHGFEAYYGMSDEVARQAIAVYREHFEAEGIKHYQPYLGIRELLEKLRSEGKVLAVATSKIEKFAHLILKNTDLERYLEVIAAQNPAKDETKGETIADALIRLGRPAPADCVMVGDRKHDIIGAQENGLDSIGVLWGYGPRDELEAAKATRIVTEVKDLFDIISV